MADALAVCSLPRYVESQLEHTRPTEVESFADQAETVPHTDAKPEPTQRRENEVEWLKSLLQSYPGSRWGNRETRGLDTEFAEKTYVETNLEEALYRAITERRVNLVVLCGNAGDGKTALLQRLAKRLGLDVQTSATRILEGRLKDGLNVQMNLDGSASWQGRSADELLNEFLAPFQDGKPAADIVHLLAINDGRLLEWVEKVEEQQGETPLTKDLSDCLENRAAASGFNIQLVNLNQRSLVGGIAADGKSIEMDFLDRLVDRLYGGVRAAEVWAPCQTCSAQERCEVFRATRFLAPMTSRTRPFAIVRERGCSRRCRPFICGAMGAILACR